MALFVYRFRLKIPVLEYQLENEVGVSVSIDDYAGGGVVDIECDDSRAQDLQDAMEDKGYEFVEGSPSTTAASRFKTDNSIVGLDEHEALRQLIHFLLDGPGPGWGSGPYYKETTYSGLKPTAEVWWETSSKTKKIFSIDTTYTGLKPSTETSKVYDTDGSTILAQAVDAITYSGLTETSRTRTITVF